MKYVFRLLALCCCMALLLSFFGCRRYEEPTLHPELPETFAGNDVFYCNGIEACAQEGVILPDFELKSSDISRYGVTLYYQNVSVPEMAVYRTQMEQAGFVVVKDTYHTYFYSDTCFVGASYTENISDGQVRLWWYTQSSCTPVGGMDAGHAKQVIGTDCPYAPIDVTPAGVWEATGGQIFYIPPYEREEQTDQNGIAVATTEYYDTFFVTEEYAVPLGFLSFALADLDKNGVQEIWTLAYGPTSGLFTFYLMAFENGALKYQTLHCTDYGQLYFAQQDGELRIEHKHPEYENGELVCYEVKTCHISFFEGEAYVSYNGLPLDIWGRR